MKYLNFLSVFFLSALFFTANAQAPAVVAAQGEVSVTRAKTMLENGALMIDVREQAEVEALAYDVENIIHIPLSELEARLNDVPKDRDLIIACRSGNRSSRAAAILAQNDYTRVLNMTGGMNVWQERELGVVMAEESAKKPSCSTAASKAQCHSAEGKAATGKSSSCASKTKAAATAGCSSKTKSAASCCASKTKATENNNR